MRLLSLGEVMTVTLRPNRRASSEYAPGPRSARAAASNMQKIQRRVPPEGPINAAAAAAIQTTTEAIGVRNPIASEIQINKTGANSNGAESTPNRFAALIRNAAATESLRTNRAIPGAP